MGLYSSGTLLARVGVLHYKLDVKLPFLFHLMLAYFSWDPRCRLRDGFPQYVLGQGTLAVCGGTCKEALTARVMQTLSQHLSECLHQFTPQACCLPHPSAGLVSGLHRMLAYAIRTYLDLIPQIPFLLDDGL